MARLSTKEKRVQEILRCGKDPIYFFNNYVNIQYGGGKGSGLFKTYPFQEDCVRSFEEHRFNIILKSRQLGISTITAAYAMWLALFRKDRNILVIATKLKVAQLWFRKCKYLLASLPEWLVMPQVLKNNQTELEFNNGSVIKAIPTSEDAGRGEALSLLIVDEAAFVRNFDVIWTGLYPTLSTGGNAVILSTPNGVGGQYYDLWQSSVKGENEFNAIKLAWDVHPERDEAWFENESRQLTKKQIAQELLCDFAASGDTYLRPEDIEYYRAHLQHPIETWGPGGNVWVWEYPKKDVEYIISADVARGDANDYSTFHVIDTEKSSVVAEYQGKLPPDQFATLLAEAGKRYNECMICPENNSYGYAVIMKLVEQDYTNLWFAKESDKYNFMYGSQEIGKIGFQTNMKTRSQILTKLEEVLRNKEVRLRSTRIFDELKTFVWQSGKVKAMKGKTDDLIMALAIGTWLYDTTPSNIGKKNTDVNKAMLQAFGTNSNSFEDSSLNKHVDVRSPFGPTPKKFTWIF
jgi:hypothetical protein